MDNRYARQVLEAKAKGIEEQKRELLNRKMEYEKEIERIDNDMAKCQESLVSLELAIKEMG